MGLIEYGIAASAAVLILVLVFVYLSRNRRRHRRLSQGVLTMPPDFVRRCANPLFCSFDRQSRYDLAQWYESISRAVRFFRSAQADEEETPQRWLMENFHLIDMIHTSLESCLRRSVKGLPFIRTGRVCVPRIRYIAHDMLEKQMCRVRQASVVRFLEEFQSRTPLYMNEIWLLHDYLELEIIGRLQRIAQRLMVRGSKFQRIDAANELLAEASGLNRWRQQIEPLLRNERDEIEAECVEYVNLCLLEMGGRAADALACLDDLLVRWGYMQERIITAAHRQRAEELILTRNAFESLKLIKEIKWSDVFEQASLVERTLLMDPGGVYPRMDDESRVRYRQRIAELAVRFRKSELYLAQSCVAFSERNSGPRNHVGFCLLDRQVGTEWMCAMGVHGRFPEKRFRRAAYGLGLLALTAAGTLAPFAIGDRPWFQSALLALTLLPAVYGIASYIVGRITSVSVRPERIPRIHIEGPLPPEAKTLVVVTALAISRGNIDELAVNLETAMLRNRAAEASYALLLDLRPSKDTLSGEDEALIDYAWKRIGELNQRHETDRFFCFVRRRSVYDADTGKHMGWERKRGALLALCELLEEGQSSQFMDIYRCPDALRGTRYVITLDADTQVGWDSVCELAGAMLHPLNRPEVTAGLVTRGYAVMQPRIAPSISSTIRTPFARIYAGDGGIETYSFAIANPYQDLFGIGIFTGKAIFDMSVYFRVLRDRFPDRAILSHDLIEGGYLRAGSLTDHVFIDDFPTTPGEYFARLHRWIRGDWQLLPWLMPFVRNRKGFRTRNILPGIVRWQIADNLLRSLYPACVPWLLAAAFFFGSGALGLAAALLPVLLPQLVSIVSGLSRRSLIRVRGVYQPFILKALLDLALLPWQAWVQLDAVVRTLIRVLFTRRNMLEWTTARQARSGRQASLGQVYRSMAGGLALTAVTAALYALSGAPLWGLAFFALWFAAPVVAWQSGREQEEERPRLSSEDEFALRRILVATWRYFRMFTRKSTCFLPPDNNQEHPPNGLAMRTSPTNIGIAALAEMMAVTLGYQSVEDTLFRLEGMMTTLEGLEKWEGHLLNWYDIREARPLHPYYVSAVDSGNLACYLILAGQMLDELLDRPRLDRETLSGYLDSAAACLCRDQQWHRQTMESLAEALVDPEGDPGAVIGEFLPDEVADTDAMGRALIEQGRELQALMRLARAYGIKTDALTLRRAAELPDRPEVRGDDAVRAILRQCRGWCVRAATLRSRMKVLTGGMNFAVLYNREKKLFHIGYDIDRDQFSNSFYDLLASEARQTSLFTIASGQVSARHWFRMGRPAAADRNSAILKSWGGTMFEYLLPDQIFRHERGTLLGESIINAVRIQREYCRARGVPWGISESGYYELDQSMNYQYRSFGVPGIGMKSGLGRDLVVSPYSTAMTFHIDALAAWENIRSIIDQGGLGYFGLYEAIDYTSGSSGKPGKGRVVRSYMVHHQGMAMMGIYNYLTRERLKKSMYAIPQISALSILLSERMLTAGKPLDQEKPAGGYRNLSAACYREECPTDRGSIANSINVLSNGNYNVIIGADGTGQSRCGGVAVNRWRSDTEIEYGIFLFVQGHDGSHPPHSVTLRPFLREPDAYHVVHECGQTVFTRRDGCLGTRLAVFVQGNRNAEVRHLRLENHSDAEMLLDVTAYTEIVLNTQQADIAHPPFQNLFIETRWDDEKKMLIAVRRKRLDQDRRYYMAARFVQEADPDAPVSIETIRNAAIGRGHSLKNPHFLTEPWEDGNIEIPVDPVLCMKTPVCIRAGDTVDIALLIGFGEEERDAVAAIAEPGSHDSLEEALELSCCQERALVRYLGVSANQIRFFNRLLPSLILNGPPHPGRLEAIRKNRLGQSGLWGMGLSGDLPIVGVEVTDSAYLRSVFHLVLAHAYWRRKQISYDLIILNRDASDYRQALQDAIMGMILSSVERDLVGKSGGIFILKEEQLSAEQKLLLRAVSVSWFDAEKPLTGQLPQAAPPPPDAGMIPVRQSLRDLTDVTMRPIETVFDNEYGGFDAHSREYVIHCSINTPMPWCMILANREFGTIVSAGGAAFTWLYNSRENKLTPWNGDPVSNPPGQDILVRDEETSAVWRISEGDGRPGHRRTRYGMGYALFESVNQGFYQQQRIIVPPDDTVMIREVSLHNQTGMRRKISVTVWTDFVLGVHRSHTAPHILVEPDAAGDAVYARNGYRDEFADTVAFIAVPGIACQYTSMRNLFHTGYEPATRSPAMRRRNLGNKAGAGGGLGALRFFAELGPGEEKCWTVLLGGAQGAPACRQIIDRYRERGAVELAQARTQAFWDDILERVTVNTPDQGINLMMNGWLLYQAIAARFMARAGFYQTGGAIGFRDQLQDCLAIVWTRPEWVREHILLCAAHQFQSGDVQHWWHPPLRGVKTRISDNMLFLPYVVSEYVLRLDDWELLKEQVPYLEDVEIPEGKEDFYGVATVSGESGTLLDHCLRAVRRACRFGRHGLPLMGAGDWNDAMSSIGDKGRGESVWLGFFLYDVLRRMSYLCERMDDRQTAQELDETARLLRQALNDAGWDGQWYRRAYDDDGNPVGSCVNNDCRIDCISQAWAAISGAGDPDKIEMGLRAMEEQLWCEEGQLLRLLAPPLRDDESELGYIKGYVPGVRENGGQYTHGAVWAVWAYVCVNRGDKAVELMRRLMPYWHAKTAEEARRYMVEPYVSAADVYAVAPHVGRGGWTWYTGSAAWMYKITLEKILGLSVYRNQLSIQPCVSPDWKEYDVTYRWGSATYFIHVKNPYGVGGGVTQTLLDGKPLEKPLFPLVDDASEHHVYVTLGEGAEE